MIRIFVNMRESFLEDYQFHYMKSSEV